MGAISNMPASSLVALKCPQSFFGTAKAHARFRWQGLVKLFQFLMAQVVREISLCHAQNMEWMGHGHLNPSMKLEIIILATKKKKLHYTHYFWPSPNMDLWAQFLTMAHIFNPQRNANVHFCIARTQSIWRNSQPHQVEGGFCLYRNWHSSRRCAMSSPQAQRCFAPTL